MAVAKAVDVEPNNTIYIRGLPERMKIPALIAALEEIFQDCGEILEIVAKKNVKAKGQAFVVFDSVQAANDALEDFQNFDFFGKTLTLEYAKTKSDATVAREGDEADLEVHKRHRMAEKERKAAASAKEAAKLKRPATDAGPTEDGAPIQKKGLKSTSGKGAGIVPDEYLPPNKILFVQNLPGDFTTDQLTSIYERFEGFIEVRAVASRKIAFIEYQAEQGAISAKEATAGMVLGEERKAMKVTFQRQ